MDAIVCKMSNIINNEESDSRDVLQAANVKMQAYAMKIDLLSNASVIDRAIKFVDRNRGLMSQNKEVITDNKQ